MVLYIDNNGVFLLVWIGLVLNIYFLLNQLSELVASRQYCELDADAAVVMVVLFLLEPYGQLFNSHKNEYCLTLGGSHVVMIDRWQQNWSVR